MHEVKDEVILRILAQESLKSKLRLQRYGEKKFQEPIWNFWKVTGANLEIYSESKGYVWNIIGLRLHFKHGQESFCKSGMVFSSSELFSNGELVDSVHHS
jgi:hypothetical protein